MDSAAPMGGLVQGRTLREPLSLDVDVVVVGSGAGGSMVARQVSRAGLRVLLLEEGAYHTPADFTQREGEMLPRLFFDAGGRSTEDGAVTILHGRGVGGSTVHNTNLCKRAPAEILRHWVVEHGAAGWSPEELARDYDTVEADLSISALTAADVNAHNAAFQRGVERLGWRGGLLAHNRVGCTRSGFCELGCAYNAKQNALKILVPQAIEQGAAVYADLRVTEIVYERGRAQGVRGHSLLADGSRGVAFTVKARAVCLSASAIGSAQLLRRSELPDPYSVAGRSLRLHPAVAVAGVFDERIEAWRGIPQSYECTEKLSFVPGAVDRSWLIPAFAHPGGFAGLAPGFGAAHAQRMRDYPHTAAIAAMLHDETRGEVASGSNGRPRIRYTLSEPDVAALRRGIHAAAEVLLAAGARKVLVPFGQPLVARQLSELAPLLSHRFRPLDPLLTSVHPMGSLPMGSDPRRSVVDPKGRHHQVGGLYVADGSLFPTSIGGPPQLTIYAAGLLVARAMCADLKVAAHLLLLALLPSLLGGCAGWHDLFQRDRANAEQVAAAMALPAPTTSDVGIALGCPTEDDGVPSACMRCRVAGAMAALKRGRVRAVIFSGGAAHNRYVEALAMAQFARAAGATEQQILVEGESLTTWQNLRFSKRIMAAHGYRTALLISARQHLPRARRFAEYYEIPVALLSCDE